MIRPWCNSHSATFMLLFFPVEIFPLTYFLHSKNIQPYCSRRAFSVHIYILSWDWYTNDPVENESFDHRHDQKGVVGEGETEQQQYFHYVVVVVVVIGYIHNDISRGGAAAAAAAESKGNSTTLKDP